MSALTGVIEPPTSVQSRKVVRSSALQYYPAEFLRGPTRRGITTVRTTSKVVAHAVNEKNFMMDFLLGGVSAAVSKTSAAPIERIKLLVQNQDEMIKQGRLAEPFKGVVDCFKRTISEEGVFALWRGNTANVIRYFPTQVNSYFFLIPSHCH